MSCLKPAASSPLRFCDCTLSLEQHTELWRQAGDGPADAHGPRRAAVVGAAGLDAVLHIGRVGLQPVWR